MSRRSGQRTLHGVTQLAGVDILAFESRRASEFRRLLVRHHARFFSAPALREAPLSENPAAHHLVEEMSAGRVDALILLTGVGTRALAEAVATHCPRERFVELLERLTLIARGPKPVAALRELGLKPHVQAPEPNTWRELLGAIDREFPVRGRCIAIQEYGRPNLPLRAGLEERGATILSVPVYRWKLPEDLGPLQSAIEQVLRGDALVVVFTSAVQLDHLLVVAGKRSSALLGALRDHCVLASIGPTASEALRAQGLDPDIEPEHPKMGYLAAAIAEHAPDRLARKKGERSDERHGGKSRLPQ